MTRKFVSVCESNILERNEYKHILRVCVCVGIFLFFAKKKPFWK